MHIVYILRSIKYPKMIYKGYTTNLQQRLKKHNSKSTTYSAKYKPWKLIFYCVFTTKQKALTFERYLKSGSGIAFMNKRLI
ncbi:GIY-YIG nuclease family protein [Patescibacteria group bacterium]|nr:GIY-YIG nuclease family protein [Patescibacteria group bacterium]MBU0964438.1 GIY-YIG nuclease family protein [Patescibacteria group bacterium]